MDADYNETHEDWASFGLAQQLIMKEYRQMMMTNIHDHDDDHDDAGNLFREEEHSDRRPTFPEFLNFIVGQLSPDPW